MSRRGAYTTFIYHLHFYLSFIFMRVGYCIYSITATAAILLLCSRKAPSCRILCRIASQPGNGATVVEFGGLEALVSLLEGSHAEASTLNAARAVWKLVQHGDDAAKKAVRELGGLKPLVQYAPTCA